MSDQVLVTYASRTGWTQLVSHQRMVGQTNPGFRKIVNLRNDI